MPPGTKAKLGIQKRDSTRIVQAVPIAVTATDALGQPFKEYTNTLVVSCHGCLYASKHYVPKNATVTLEIPRSAGIEPVHLVRAQVVWVARPRAVREMFRIGIRFELPGNVWGVAFPPEDWFHYPGGVNCHPSAEPEEISGDFDLGICAELEESDSREDLNYSPSESPDLSMHSRTGGSASSQELRYEVALSFAGEDRSYVERTARALKRRGIRTFYDKYEVAALWGKDLYEHLDSIYRKRSKYTVMFISKHYATKLWTNHERKSAQARAFEESKEYILPARFDDTEVPGLLATVGYIDLNTVTPAEFADLIAEKLRTS